MQCVKFSQLAAPIDRLSRAAKQVSSPRQISDTFVNRDERVSRADRRYRWTVNATAPQSRDLVVSRLHENDAAECENLLGFPIEKTPRLRCSRLDADLDPVTLRCSRLLARAAKGDGRGRLRGQRERTELSKPNGLCRQFVLRG
jgi:hypothetical protein